MQAQNGPDTGDRHAVDVSVLERVAADLLPLSQELQQQAVALTRHAPDPGEPPANEHVWLVQSAAVDALQALSCGLDDSAAVLRLQADRYHGVDGTARALRRTGRDRL